MRSLTRSLPYAREAEHAFSALALGLVGPFLSQMIVVLLNDCEAGVVPIVWRFQSRDRGERKYQRLLHIRDGGRHHVRLIPGRAVVRRNQVVTIDREHRNHHRPGVGSKLFHQGAPVCCERVSHVEFTAFFFTFPLSLERCQTIKGLLTLRLVRSHRSGRHNDGHHTNCPTQRSLFHAHLQSCFKVHRRRLRFRTECPLRRLVGDPCNAKARSDAAC